jgi:immune inhibitor A
MSAAALVPVATATAVPPGATSKAVPAQGTTAEAIAAVPAAAVPAAGGEVAQTVPAGPDELPNPQEDKRRALRQEALRQVIQGTAKVQQRNGSSVVKLPGTSSSTAAGAGGARYVELARQKTDKIFVVLAEFGDQRDPAYPDQDTDPATPGPAVFNGPLHNSIPQPDPSLDNSTVWQPDYSPEHYRQLYFGTGPGVESLKTYYETQSSGRYSVDGEVSDWVKVKYNEARYGRSNGFPCAGIVCSNTWDLLRDALNQWVADQKAAGRTDAQIKADLAQYDQWDRYDHDGDGNFNEPDGYIDHFQIVHAGGDQADGDPAQGEDAIWSHRWYAYINQAGTSGPAANPLGGTEIGDTGMWVGDYTIQPENGGLSVFAHEYGHDLGLPDDYDTAGGVGEPVEWWSLMAQSRLSAQGESIGTRPGDIGAWQKLLLGWLDYAVVPAGYKGTMDLGPEEYNSDNPQAAIVLLPKKTVTTQLATPPSGSHEWWSGSGDALDNTLTRQVTLPAGPAALDFKAKWDIEDCGPDPCDYAYVEVNTGSGWTAIPGSITDPTQGNGIKGTTATWVPAEFDLSAYAGKTIGLRLRYVTDPAAGGLGFFADDISVTGGGHQLFSDGAETLDPAWTADGFTRSTGTKTQEYDNFYIAGNRSYTGFDAHLQTGPYNFGFATAKPDLVEHFAYQQGLLVSYWDTSQDDNNVSQHPGEGLNLYVDSHPKTLYRSDGQPWRTRVQMYDAPFSTKNTDSMVLHVDGTTSRIKSQGGHPVFDDTDDFFDPVQVDHGVKLRNAGVKIQVVSENGTSMKIRFARAH